MERFLRLLAFAGILTAAPWTFAAAPRVSPVAGGVPAPSVRHGLSKLRSALGQKGVTVEDAVSLAKAGGAGEVPEEGSRFGRRSVPYARGAGKRW